MLTDTNKNSTENHANWYSQPRLKVMRSIVDRSHLYFYFHRREKHTHTHMTFCKLIWSEFAQHHAVFYYRACLQNRPIISSSSNSITLPNKLLLCECLSNISCKSDRPLLMWPSPHTHNANSQELHLLFPVFSIHSTWSCFGLNPAAGRLSSAPDSHANWILFCCSERHQNLKPQKGYTLKDWNGHTHTFIDVNLIQDIQ